jgi:ATP-dependent helicase HrpA
MTDGILLAETQSDPLLRAVRHDHRRRGARAQPQHRLSCSATCARSCRAGPTCASSSRRRRSMPTAFAHHFAGADGPGAGDPGLGSALSGRDPLAPFVESRDHDLGDAICDAVDELWRGAGAAGSGDVLVFLPGEREIRDAAERLRKHHPPGVEVLPLFARLSQQQQDEVFAPHSARRIVLGRPTSPRPRSPCPASASSSTPARRGSSATAFRSKVEQLPIEPISQAAANQRAGAAGASPTASASASTTRPTSSRAEVHRPEIVRSSLAGVILRMQSLNLGSVEDFPVPRGAAEAGDRRRLPAAQRARRDRRPERADDDRAASSRACRSIRASAG